MPAACLLFAAALGQVVALLLRSAGRAGQAGPVPPEAELDYPAVLNRVLPQDIRVLGWTDVPEDFSARSAPGWQRQGGSGREAAAGKLPGMGVVQKALPWH